MLLAVTEAYQHLWSAARQEGKVKCREPKAFEQWLHLSGPDAAGTVARRT